MPKALQIVFLLCISVATAFGQKVQLQIIHNAADPAASVVDVYINDSIALDDFAFRTATSFLEFEPGVEFVVKVAPGSSQSAEEALATIPLILPAGRYVAVANGVLNEDEFAPSPDPNAAPISFQLFAQPGVLATAADGFVNLMVFHGATDAVAVDVYAGESKVVPNLSYGSFSSTLTVPASVYQLGIGVANEADILARFVADVSPLGGQSVTVLASGFLAPADNMNGPAFGLFAATAAGGALIELPLLTDVSAINLQVIHNAADPAAARVDVYVNGSKLLDDFAFRTATQFVELPAGVPYTIAIAPESSESVEDAIATFTYELEPGTYILVANGVLDTTMFAANSDPNALPIGFDLYPISDAREAAAQGNNVDILVFHGATDAPAVDILAGDARLVENLSYGTSASEYLEVPAGVYTLGVAPTGGAPIAQFTADVTELAGSAITVLASGFLTPSANQGGPAFGLWVALASGGALIELPAASVSVREWNALPGGINVMPTPASSNATISFANPSNAPVLIEIIDVTGSVVFSQQREVGQGSTTLSLPLSGFSDGVYRARVVSGNFVSTSPVVIVK